MTFAIYDKQNDVDIATGFETEEAAYEALHHITQKIRSSTPNALISEMFTVYEEDNDDNR